MLHSVRSLFERDLELLAVEVGAFEHEEDLWRTIPGTTNSPGVLAMHVCGNLRHFIGAALGGSDYVRNREAEFAARDIPRSKVLEEIEMARAEVALALNAMSDDELGEPFPREGHFDDRTIGFALVHVHGHLNYHLGQINYARRFISRQAPDAP